MDNYWVPIEKQWFSRYENDLRPYVEICGRSHEVVAEIAQHSDFISGPPSACRTVQRLLVRRLGEELRGVEILALSGHGLQAVSAAANLFEQSHFVTYAAEDQKVAEKYLSWSDFTTSVASVKSVVERSGKLRGWDRSRVDAEYGKYRFLCAFKHNNGMMQRILQYPKDPDLVLAQLAMSEAGWFTLTAMALVAVSSLDNDSLTKVLVVCNEIMDAIKSAVPLAVAGVWVVGFAHAAR